MNTYFKYFSNSSVTILRPQDKDAFGNVVSSEQTIIEDVNGDFQDQGSSLRRARLLHEETQAVLFLFQDIDNVAPEDIATVDGVDYTVLSVNTLDNSLFLAK